MPISQKCLPSIQTPGLREVMAMMADQATRPGMCESESTKCVVGIE